MGTLDYGPSSSHLRSDGTGGDRCGPGPTGILYFPFLTGSGPPEPDANAKGAFIGLTQGHTRGHLCKAVLEGTSYQMERVRETARACWKGRWDGSA